MSLRGLQAAAYARRVLNDEELAKIRQLRIADEGHGYDRFGMSQTGIAFALALMKPLYKNYFRVTSHGAHNIPSEGAAILASNHSGMLPIDAFMMCCDVVWQGQPPRPLRVVMDHFVDLLPGAGVFFTRAGAVSGSRGNFHNLLDQGELVAVFPEGTPGIGKPFSERYKLQEWRIGHAELAIRHQVPVVPVAVVGAEEQWPQLTRLPIQFMGAPYLPIPVLPFPLPVHYHILYGAPIPIPELFEASDCMRADAVHQAAMMVRDSVADLIRDGLELRDGVFR
jgi:1-acyl-sn-glycerol-3-phosphate acyltransferase